MIRTLLACMILLATSGICLAQGTATDGFAPAAAATPKHHVTHKVHAKKHAAKAKHARKHATAKKHAHHARAHAKKHHGAKA